MGKISDIQNNIKSRIDKQFNKLKEKREQAAKKRLAARLKYMNDDELEEYIMLQIKKLQKGNKDTKKEAKNAVVTAIQSMDEPEKQLEVTAQISGELTESDKGEIIESIDSTAALLDDNGIDIIKGLDQTQKLEIVERIITNQKIKAEKVSITEITDAVDKIYSLTNEANDFTLLKYIGIVNSRMDTLKKSDDIPASTKEQINKTQLKLIKLAAKKVVCNYKNIGYSMRIREFMKAALPDTTVEDIRLAIVKVAKSKGESKTANNSLLTEAEQQIKPKANSNSLFLDAIKTERAEITPKNIRKSLFLDFVEVEGNKIGLKNAKSIIGDLLEKEEESYRIGKIKKLQRDSGKGAMEEIVKLQSQDNDDARS